MRYSKTSLSQKAQSFPWGAILVYAHVTCTAIWIFSNILFPYFSFTYLRHIVGLTAFGIDHWYLWQYFTYFFTDLIMPYELLEHLFSFAIKMYLLWTGATMILDRKSYIQLLLFYFLCGIFGGIFSAIYIKESITMFPYMNSFGPTLGLLVAWTMLSPSSKIYLLNQIPIKLKSLVSFIFLFVLIASFSSGNWAHAINIFSITFFSYFYSIIVWGCHGPFHALYPIEKTLLKIFRKRN